MRSIFSLMIDYSDKSFRIPLFAFLGIVLVYIIYRFIKKEGVLKFIPSILLVIVGCFTFFMGYSKITSMAGVSLLELSVLSFSVGFITLFYAWMLNIYIKSQRKR